MLTPKLIKKGAFSAGYIRIDLHFTVIPRYFDSNLTQSQVDLCLRLGKRHLRLWLTNLNQIPCLFRFCLNFSAFGNHGKHVVYVYRLILA